MFLMFSFGHLCGGIKSRFAQKKIRIPTLNASEPFYLNCSAKVVLFCETTKQIGVFRVFWQC